MSLRKYHKAGMTIYFKEIAGIHPKTNKRHILGMAFRTSTAPVGYLPYYDRKDLDMNGDVSFFESAAVFIPVFGSFNPQAFLIKGAAGDVNFLSSGSDSSELNDIQREVRKDTLNAALSIGRGIFVDGILMALGGPGISKAVGSVVKSKTAAFVFSQSIEYKVGTHIKNQGGPDISKYLKNVP